jgi:hypothetical protein
MSDNNGNYSSFWPLLILLSGLTVWSAYQLYAINSQRIAINQQYAALAPGVAPSQNAEAKLRALVQDLIQTSAKDTYAAQILKESVQAGILHVNKSSGTNSTASPAAPAK